MTCHSLWRWAAAVSLAVGLVVFYFTAWRPARALLTQHIAHPLLTSIETDRSRAFRYHFERGSLRIRIRAPQLEGDAPDYHAPAGRTFLLPALLLILLFPYRPYWLYLWGFHLAAGVLFLGLVALGVAWVDGAFVVQGILEKYVVQALSLGAPLLALGHERGLLLSNPVDAPEVS